MKAAQLGLSRRRTRRGLARLLVLLPRRLLAGGGAVEGVSAAGAGFRAPRELQTSHYNEEAKSSKEVCKKD